MNYHIYYFSGTGNSEHSVEMIEKALTEQGHSVKLKYISRGAVPLESTPDRLVLVFPVYSGMPPVLVNRFLRKLPRQGKARTKAAVLAVAGGGAMAAPAVAAGCLIRRGYQVFIKASANYAENWTQVMSSPEGEDLEKKTFEGERMVNAFIEKLAADKAWNGHKTGLSGYIIWPVGYLYQWIGRRMLGKIYIADDSCTSCGLCEKVCPAGTIVMSKGKQSRPYWKLNCECCNRCINVCPAKAINTSIGRIILGPLLVAAICIPAVILYGRYAAPLYASLPDCLRIIIGIFGYYAVIVLGHLAGVTVLELLQKLFLRIRPLAKFMHFSFTRNFARYKYAGYKPPQEKHK